jgi:hypothetical protein
MPALLLLFRGRGTYKYYVTTFGKEVVATALKLRELVMIPQLALGLAQ